MSFGGDVYGPGDGEIFLDSFRCIGDEEFLLDCFHRTVEDGTCSHAHDVGVKCSREQSFETNIRTDVHSIHDLHSHTSISIHMCKMTPLTSVLYI